MAQALDPSFLTAAVLAYFNSAPVQVQRPGYNQPDFWSIPITHTAIEIVPSAPQWVTVLTLTTPDEYQTLLKEYIATVIGGMPATGVQFRLWVNEGLPGGIQRIPGAALERNFTGQYPLVRQPIDLVLTDLDLLRLQVRNTTGGPVTVACGLFGWHFYDPGEAGQREDNTTVDT